MYWLEYWYAVYVYWIHSRHLSICLSPTQSGAYIYIQAQRGHSGGLGQGQQHQEHRRNQLHQVEQVVVGEQVRTQCPRVPRVREELVIVFTLLFKNERESSGRRIILPFTLYKINSPI